ncbi:MAG: hypothetical protein ABI024_14290 [Vicinamibacterales bacterium]
MPADIDRLRHPARETLNISVKGVEDFMRRASLIGSYIALVLGCACAADVAALPTDPIGFEPSRVEVPRGTVASVHAVFESLTEIPRYDPDKHQDWLLRPNAWCGTPRPDEPLLNEASRMVRRQPNDFFGLLGHYIAASDLDSATLTFVTDESLCEKAARVYDRVAHESDLLLEDHLGLQAALMLSVGNQFLVEQARPRNGFYEVILIGPGLGTTKQSVRRRPITPHRNRDTGARGCLGETETVPTDRRFHRYVDDPRQREMGAGHSEGRRPSSDPIAPAFGQDDPDDSAVRH